MRKIGIFTDDVFEQGDFALGFELPAEVREHFLNGYVGMAKLLAEREDQNGQKDSYST